jgi:hypothetical protein
LSRSLESSSYAYVYLDATYLKGRLGKAQQVCSRAVVVAMGAGPPKSVSMACWRGLTALALVGGNGSPPCPKSLTQQLISLIPAI